MTIFFWLLVKVLTVFFWLLVKVLNQTYLEIYEVIPIIFPKKIGKARKTYSQKTLAKYKLLHEKILSKKFTSLGNNILNKYISYMK